VVGPCYPRDPSPSGGGGVRAPWWSAPALRRADPGFWNGGTDKAPKFWDSPNFFGTAEDTNL